MRIIRTVELCAAAGLLLAASGGAAGACSNGIFSRGGKTIIGRNMDWPSPAGWVVINERGAQKSSLLAPRQNAAAWKSRYGYVSFNLTGEAKGRGFASVPGGGMNEKGLYIGSLWSPETKFDAVPSGGGKAIGVPEAVGFVLAQYATVEEALAGLDSVSILPFNTGALEVNLHWLVADSSGAVAYVQYRGGRKEVFRNPELPVMTNEFYGDERAYVKDRAGFGGTREIPAVFGNSSIKCLDRFLLLSKAVHETADGLRPLDAPSVFAALYAARQAPAKASAQSSWRSATQWTEVYDYSTRTIYWRSLSVPGTKSLKLDDIQFDPTGTKRLLDIHREGEGDMSDKFTFVF
ncbi:MAG: linear amide C-N hydrolase [Elusimicrobiales bacterium]|nr:linear amide C-N hydrolase [Elusimicrobiales bacterium]